MPEKIAFNDEFRCFCLSSDKPPCLCRELCEAATKDKIKNYSLTGSGSVLLRDFEKRW